MNILGTKAWMWIDGITLIIVGALSLVPAAAAIILFDGGTVLSVIKIIVAIINLVVAVRETDAEMVNSKIWLIAVALILLFMGILPFFPVAMGAMGGQGLADFLNTMKVVLGALTLLIIIVDWSKLGP
ncbi:MAG: hypothetical protein EAX87_07785 [Candidatus Thorarchaeota archaeon]|nr:hypothetical protein [Candidatus Thorarchaeota archaeon]